MMKKNIVLFSLIALLSIGYSYASSVSNADGVTVRAKKIISDAFASMDTWIERDLQGSMYVASNKIQPDIRGEIDNSQFVSMTNSLNDSTEKGVKIRLFSANQVLPRSSYSQTDPVYGYSSQSKSSLAINYMNKALDNLGNKLGDVPGMQTVKDTVGRAIKALATETTPDQVNSRALRIMDDSLKTLMLAPVKLAVHLTTNAVGGAAGVVGGSAAGFGAGVNRTANAIMSQEVDGSLESVAIAIPTTMAHVLKGVVNTAKLTAYGAAEGGLAGVIVAADLANRGAGDILRLEKSNTTMKDNSSVSPAERKIGNLAQIQPAKLNDDSLQYTAEDFTASSSTTPNFIIPTDPVVVKANSLYDEKMYANEDFNNAEEDTPEDDYYLQAYLHADKVYGDHYGSLNSAQKEQHDNYVTQKQAAASQTNHGY